MGDKNEKKPEVENDSGATIAVSDDYEDEDEYELVSDKIRYVVLAALYRLYQYIACAMALCIVLYFIVRYAERHAQAEQEAK